MTNEFNSTAGTGRASGPDIGRRILAQIPTRFGQLVFLWSLRDPVTGRYAYPALESTGRETADRTLCHTHNQVFKGWIGLDLADQKADLDEYLRGTPTPLNALPYRELVPAAAHEVERQLYITDLELLLQLLQFEHGEAFALPKAWPRP